MFWNHVPRFRFSFVSSGARGTVSLLRLKREKKLPLVSCSSTGGRLGGSARFLTFTFCSARFSDCKYEWADCARVCSSEVVDMLAKVVVELDAEFGWRMVGWRFSCFLFLACDVGARVGGTSTASGTEGKIGDGGSMIGEDGGGELVSGGTSTLSAAGADFFFFFGFFFFFFLAPVCGASSSSTSSMVTVRPIPAVNIRK
jgi:hypothetical protein